MNGGFAFEGKLKRDQVLLTTIKANLHELERLAPPFADQYEEGIYRLYHHSFKVYSMQDCTVGAVKVFRNIGEVSQNTLCQWFEEIVAAGTRSDWNPNHNENWLIHTRPIVEAFLHTKYFLEMMLKYGNEMRSAPTVLPSGWAAILELYNQR
jgi:hypothetical protein